MEYCNQNDLHKYLQMKKRIPENEALDLFLQILNAFKCLIGNNIMHRDFKLANILLHNGVVKVADFGFSKIQNEIETNKTILGSPLNMAPEMFKGESYDLKADVWSLGVCLYEMIFGKPPFIGESIK